MNYSLVSRTTGSIALQSNDREKLRSLARKWNKETKERIRIGGLSLHKWAVLLTENCK